MDPNPFCLGPRKFHRFVSHQRHITLYLASIFGTDCVVGYYACRWADNPSRTVLDRWCVETTLRDYLVHLGEAHGFLIDLGTRYRVEYNNDRRQLNINGFWIDCEIAEIDTPLHIIREYIESLKFAHLLPPVKREHYFHWHFPRPPPHFH